MKQGLIWVLVCVAGNAAFAATQASVAECTATLPDGTTIELVGLRNYSIRDLEKFKDRNYPWWRPDGTVLLQPPDTGRGRTSSPGSYWLVLRVQGDKGSDFKAVGPYGNDLTVQPVRRKAPDFEKEDLRYFTLRFSSNQTKGEIKLGVATDDWQAADRWSIEPDWTPYNLSIGSSDQLVMRCPEQVGLDTVVEVTQIVTERTARLVLFDHDGNQYESRGEIKGEGVGLIRYVHRFRNLDRKSIRHIEFQVRPFRYWITFSNISLQPEHKTQPKVDIQQPGALLKGDALPGFDGIELDFAAEGNEGKMLLICFFDMNQRPSRRRISEMAKQAGQLRQNGIFILAIQATKIRRDKLDAWAKNNGIPFAVGLIEEDVEKARFTWGVKSLPWLILTDRRHLVVDVDFGFSELADKIKAAR